MTSRNTILKNSIDGFLARRGMSRSRFGLETAGNPSLVARIAAGRVIRLGSADRILAYMGKEPFGPAFRREVEAFIAITGTKASLLGQEAVGDPSFVQAAAPRRLAEPRYLRPGECLDGKPVERGRAPGGTGNGVRGCAFLPFPPVPASNGRQRWTTTRFTWARASWRPFWA